MRQGLLISAPGASLSAGVPGSLLVASLLRGLPCPVLPQESSHLPLQSTGDNHPKEMLHTFLGIVNCVAILIFKQAAVGIASTLAFILQVTALRTSSSIGAKIFFRVNLC